MTDDIPFRQQHLSLPGDGLGRSLYVREAGPETGPALLFLHGWPESALAWEAVMRLAASAGFRALAVDLPGVGGSTMLDAPTDKLGMATLLHEAIAGLSLRNLTLVGQDVGGQVAFAWATAFPDDLARVVIMDVVIPGVGPWEDVLRNPFIWHFAFHAIPDLPELLVSGKQRQYFDYFYEAIAGRPDAIPPDRRDAYAAAYADAGALATGFGWYRAFPEDARRNAAWAKDPARVVMPLLYLRGEHEGGDLDAYLNGFLTAGFDRVEGGVVPGAGHFAPEEAPDATWERIAAFIAANP